MAHSANLFESGWVRCGSNMVNAILFGKQFEFFAGEDRGIVSH